MNYKDFMGKEIKDILEEETKDMKLSSKTLDKIMKSREISLIEKISNFLNKKIRISIAPAILGFVLILGISMFPKNFPTTEKLEIIEINGSQIIMKSKREVARK